LQKQLVEEEKNAIVTKLEVMQARKIAEPFFSLISRPALCDKSASNSSAKVMVGMKRGTERKEKNCGT